MWVLLADLDVHPDVSDGVRALHRAGLRLATLTNGSTHTLAVDPAKTLLIAVHPWDVDGALLVN
ncbi:hypothetical protein ACFOY4_22340 [Actinomadura syzygii]|uniref:hypothetical protein n=1 Tax=Actinomadura syzygii TaxID=1427538 RepID=UPI00165245B2|nr:hypothetical protein [Actinomadura syzygii]